MNLSKFHMVSLGIVSEHKKPSSKMIKVMPAEVLTELDGELRSIPVELFSTGVDSHNRKYTVQITGDTSLPAKWLQLGSHRQTAPDVRRGERVIIWQHADDNQYYWSCYGMDDNLRRLETVAWAFSNISDPTENVEALTAENSYIVEVSTHGKYITIRTNKYDGEPFAYVIQLNTKDGNFTIRDDAGNYMQLDSANTTIDFTNKMKTFLRLKEKNILAYAPDSIMMKAVNKMELECTDYILKAKNSATISTKTYKATAETMYNEAQSITNKAQSITCDTPIMTCTGLFVCAGFTAGGGGGGAFAGMGPLEAFAGTGANVAQINIPMQINQGATVSNGLTTDSITASSWIGYPANWPN